MRRDGEQMRSRLTGDGQICLPILELGFLQEFRKLGADVTVSERSIRWEVVGGVSPRTSWEAQQRICRRPAHATVQDWSNGDEHRFELKTDRDQWLAIERDKVANERTRTGVETAYRKDKKRKGK